MLVLDLRDREAFDRNRLPGARHLADAGSAAIAAADTIVVYAGAGADAGPLHGLAGAAHVLRLRGGVEAWNDDVLFPVLRSDARSGQQRDFTQRAERSRYFGGSPRLLEAGASPQRGRSRHGC